MSDAQQAGAAEHLATLAEGDVESDRRLCHDPGMRRWLELSIEIVPLAGDALATWLVDRGAPGVIEEEVADRLRLRAHFLSGEGAERIVDDARLFLRDLDEPFPGAARASLKIGFVDEEDWASSWKQSFPPLEVGRGLCVRTPWSPAPSVRHDVQILPAMAFGTGHHASTLGCLLAMEDVFEVERAIPTVLDVGTGSGILAIAAGRLGARRVLAIDVDPVAVAAAADNVSRNGLDGIATARRGSTEAIEGRYSLIVANLYADLLCASFRAFAAAAEARGGCIVSGFLDADAARVRQTAAQSGWRLEAERSLEGWTTLTLRHQP
jgi:ribosomal protein L11 methyltransferase